MLTPGDLLGERYQLDAPIASGGMGEVWRATDTTLDRTVALKVLRSAVLADPGFDARFRAEARTMASLHHPNVVNVYDYGRSRLADGTSAAFLVMTYVDGEPLSDRLAAAGRLPVADTMAILAQAADALSAAHERGIVHRDVKPANLLVQPDGTVTLVDFGIARSAAVTSVTASNAVLGTALYMAPEQATGQPVTPATDIYALGAVAFHCLAGTPPFNGQTVLEIALHHVSDDPPPLPADVPTAARALVARALVKEPTGRFPTAAAFAAAARAAMTAPDAVQDPEPAGPVPVAATGAGPGAGPAAGRATRPAVTSELPVVPAARRRRTGPLVAAAVVLLVALVTLVALAILLAPGGSTNSTPADRPSNAVTPTGPTARPTGSHGEPIQPAAGSSTSPAGAPVTAPATSAPPAQSPATTAPTPVDTPTATGAPSGAAPSTSPSIPASDAASVAAARP